MNKLRDPEVLKAYQEKLNPLVAGLQPMGGNDIQHVWDGLERAMTGLAEEVLGNKM